MKTFTLFLVILIIAAAAVSANEFETKMQAAFQSLTTGYAEAYPSAGMKSGLSVLEFEENLSSRKKGLGKILQNVVAQKITTSQIFYLIDRDTLNESLKEIELSLSGAVDDSEVIEVGKLAGVQVFITGSVSEQGNDFLVVMKIINVETGIVAAVETILFPQKLLYDKKREFAFDYISQYGLGINLQYGSMFVNSPAESYMMDALDAFINYRPLLWLNFRLGISKITYQPQSVSGIDRSVIYPDPLHPYAPGASASVNYNTAYFDTVGLFGGVDFNWTPVQFFNLGLGVSINMITPTLIQNYTPLQIDDGSQISDAGNLYIEQVFWPLTIVRVEVKPQFFLSPRMTVGLYGALLFANKVRVYKTTINGEIYYPEDFASDEGIAKYSGLNPRILADGKNIEDLDFNFGFILGASINFYF